MVSNYRFESVTPSVAALVNMAYLRDALRRPLSERDSCIERLVSQSIDRRLPDNPSQETNLVQTIIVSPEEGSIMKHPFGLFHARIPITLCAFVTLRGQSVRKSRSPWGSIFLQRSARKEGFHWCLSNERRKALAAVRLQTQSSCCRIGQGTGFNQCR